MSLARVITVNKSRKDQGTCGKCGADLPKGSPYRHYTVGFRGFTRKRCMKNDCTPLPSERESSLVAGAYAAQEEADYGSIVDTETLHAVRDTVAEQVREVASEYESNEMYERNYDLQERAETLNSAADDLESWEPDEEEPTLETWEPNDEDELFESVHQEWLDTATQDLENVINEMELP